MVKNYSKTKHKSFDVEIRNGNGKTLRGELINLKRSVRRHSIFFRSPRAFPQCLQQCRLIQAHFRLLSSSLPFGAQKANPLPSCNILHAQLPFAFTLGRISLSSGKKRNSLLFALVGSVKRTETRMELCVKVGNMNKKRRNIESEYLKHIGLDCGTCDGREKNRAYVLLVLYRNQISNKYSKLDDCDWVGSFMCLCVSEHIMPAASTKKFHKKNENQFLFILFSLCYPSRQKARKKMVERRRWTHKGKSSAARHTKKLHRFIIFFFLRSSFSIIARHLERQKFSFFSSIWGERWWLKASAAQRRQWEDSLGRWKSLRELGDVKSDAIRKM